MLVAINIASKHFGDKTLYRDLQITIEKNEKIGLIGRNGVGKSTLFAMLTNADTDYDGQILVSRNTIIVSTRQEHIGYENQPVIKYILSELPKYTELKNTIDSFAKLQKPSINQLNKYSDAINHFSSLGYYDIEESVLRQLETYQITNDMAKMPLINLSGGQKRFCELVKISHSNADLILIDEPTNHMDYFAKNAFIEWVKSAHSKSIFVITHDRDVLANMDRIIEIKDCQAISYNGNYDAYLKQNSTNTINSIQTYEVAQATIANLKKQIEYAKSRAPGYKGKSANNPWVVMRNRLEKELVEVEKSAAKPSFWIDSESLNKMHNKTTASYHKYKAKNIRIVTDINNTNQAQLPIIMVNDLSVGYDKPLFKPISFKLLENSQLRLHGRNGAGKTTLIKYLLKLADGSENDITNFSGKAEIRPKTQIGIYEQEIASKYIDLTLGQAIERLYLDKNIAINEQRLYQIMSDYLFDPISDAKLTLKKLSGGQKARFQIIAMLCNNPQLLILDEPTNHLDLPSIEELESALLKYKGAILFVSHDSYFVSKFTYEQLEIAN